MGIKKNILIISYYYPPTESIASKRLVAFSKYLDKRKYNIFVLTVTSNVPVSYDDDVNVYGVPDKNILPKAKFDKATNIYFHKLKALYNIFINTFFEEHSGWYKKAREKASEIIEKHNIDLIISSYSPAASHKVALDMKKKNPNIKWIADMRDEMSTNRYLTYVQRLKLTKLENKVLSLADAITTVSKPIMEDFEKKASNKQCLFREIRNGYDFNIEPPMKYSGNQTFTIVYAGSFYGDIQPTNFLKALENLLDKNMLSICVKFFGSMKPFFIAPKLKNKITVFGKISHYQVIEELKKADLLLLISPKNSRKGVYTGKLFEYLGLLRPILALVPENDVASILIQKSNIGYLVEYENIEGIESKLLEAYTDWESKKRIIPNLDIIEKHHRKEQVYRLEALIGDLLK